MNKKIKIVYCLPSLYIPGGMERVLTIKANYFAEKLGYDIYIILTDGKGLEPFYALSPKVHLIHLDINFNDLCTRSYSSMPANSVYTKNASRSVCLKYGRTSPYPCSEGKLTL